MTITPPKASRGAGSAPARPILVCREHIEAISDVLAKIQGIARADILTASDLLDFADTAERALAEAGIAGAHRSGAALYVTPSGASSAAYKFRRLGTALNMVRKTSGWFLLSVYRQSAWPKQRGEQRLTLTARQKALTIKSVMKRYGISIQEAGLALHELFNAPATPNSTGQEE